MTADKLTNSRPKNPSPVLGFDEESTRRSRVHGPRTAVEVVVGRPRPRVLDVRRRRRGEVHREPGSETGLRVRARRSRLGASGAADSEVCF